MSDERRTPDGQASHGSPLLRLVPDPARLGLDALYAGLTLPVPRDPTRAWVALCMVTSLDGAVAVNGRSGGLGGEADRAALSRLRGANDVSLVGASTVRRERYGPLTGTPARRRDRVERGLRPAPRLAILTSTGDLDPGMRVFAEPDDAPIVLAGNQAPTPRLRALESVAEVHRLDASDRLDAVEVVDVLVRLGLRRVLLEGGPTVNAAMIQAGLIDEFFVTVAPTAVGGPASRIIQGSDELVTPLRLVSAFTHDGDLLLRHRRLVDE